MIPQPRKPLPQPDSESFLFGGGLDLVTPRLAKKPGAVIGGINFEPGPEGYTRVDGYERFDGRPSPSDAQYWVLEFTAGTVEIVVGTTYKGGTSAVTFEVLGVTLDSGAWDGTGVGLVYLTVLSGTWTASETIKSLAGVTHATSTDSPVLSGAATDALNTTYSRAAIDAARAKIGTITGSGPIRGGHVLNGAVYAFRDNAGGTAGGMWKATTAGWVAQSLGRSLAFTAGLAAGIADGDTITKGAASCVVGRVIVESGAFATNDAAGRLILIGTQTGTFTAGSIQVSASNRATIAGDSTAQSLPPGGRYDCITENFAGATDRVCMYAANGVGTAFEWDGTVFVPLVTGMAVDTPTHVAAHKSHLFLSFPGGSVQFSGIGDPYSWTPLLGAGEIGIGQEVTGLLSQLNTLMIAGTNTIKLLYGNDADNWDLQPHSKESGVIEWTLQQLIYPIFQDGAGLRELSASQNYGDMSLGSLSTSVEPMMRKKSKNGVVPVSSIRVKDKNQYRLYFSDGSGIVMYLVGGKPQIMPIEYSVAGVKKIVRCAFFGENSSGGEILFFGSDDGYLYQMDKGGSFDGETLTGYIRTAYFHAKSPQVVKQWKTISLETDAPPIATIRLRADFDYAAEETVSSDMSYFTLRGGGGQWDESNWSEFFWSSPTESTVDARIKGRGKSVSFVLSTESVYDGAFSINSATVQFQNLRIQR